MVGVGVMDEVGFELLLVWGEPGRCKGGGRGVLISVSVLVGVIRDVVSFLGV